jgi:Rne/Rng family ribonuclease
MSRKIFIFSRGSRRHVAFWSADRLVAYGVVDPSHPDRTGAVFLGRVKRVEPSLGAAFVEFIPGEDGLLPLSGVHGLTEGSSLLVQLRRDRRGTKAARLGDAITLIERDLRLRVGRPGIETYPQMTRSSRMEAACRVVAGLLAPEHGALLRPSILEASASQIEAQVDRLLKEWRSLSASTLKGPPQLVRAAEDAVDQALRDFPNVDIVCADRTTAQAIAARAAARGYGVPRTSVLSESHWLPSAVELSEALADARGEHVELSGGGSLLFEPGQTLVAIDVNSGDGSARGNTSSDRARLALNRSAAEEIALQIRLRSLSGPIVIDFVTLRRRSDQGAVVDALRSACCADPQPCEILPMSRFGLVEMVRQSGGWTLAEQLRGEP